MSLIVFEDQHLLVVNKPAGWNTHAPSPFAGEGIYEWLRHREPRWARLAIVHRLDKETSGVMVFGKTREANRSLTQQFASHEVRKKYRLITDRAAKPGPFTVSSNIARIGEKYASRPVGEFAETRFGPVTASDGRFLVEVEPATGRTHQIRVHAAENGFPIWGDTLYGGTPAERVFLHAVSISFRHPANREPVTFVTDPDWMPPSIALRRAVIDRNATDSWRVIHGASDGRAGFHVDLLGEFMLAQSETELSAGQRELLKELARAHAARGVYHKLLNRNARRITAERSSPQRLFGEPAPDRFIIHENGLRFELSFNEGYSIGLFLDQRDNRRRLLMSYIAPDFFINAHTAAGELGPVASAPLREVAVLNLFAYTCGFSVAAAKAGAHTTSLDLSKKYLAWGKRNFVLNGLDPAQHNFIFGDAFDWMRRLAKKGRRFDCVILDPPTFSQSKASGAWQAGRDYAKLVTAVLPLLKAEGVLFASTNAAKLAPEEFLDSIKMALRKAGRGISAQHYVPQPPDLPITRAEPAYLKTVWMRIR